MATKNKKEFTKAYVEKANLSNVHVLPVPEDLENWIEIDFDPEFNYRGKVYNLETQTFDVCGVQKNQAALLRRKDAYKERSDPLFIEWQFDKTEEAELLWRNEVAAIKAEFPIT